MLRHLTHTVLTKIKAQLDVWKLNFLSQFSYFAMLTSAESPAPVSHVTQLFTGFRVWGHARARSRNWCGKFLVSKRLGVQFGHMCSAASTSRFVQLLAAHLITQMRSPVFNFIAEKYSQHRNMPDVNKTVFFGNFTLGAGRVSKSGAKRFFAASGWSSKLRSNSNSCRLPQKS